MASNGRDFRAGVALVVASLLACPPARALVSLNDGRDRIFVTGSASVTHDSNIFANSDNSGDLVYASTLTAEYTRRAGWIGVNGSVSVSSSQFAKFSGENFTNPSLGLEFTKQSGRTTGSFTLSGSRESRADAAVNVRSDSWNYNTGLNFKYPIVNNYSLTGRLGYASRNYVNEAVFADLSTYTASFDLYKILTAEREMTAGYRYRYSETSHNTASTDHNVSLGVTGRLIRGVMGSVSFGYQTRVPHGGTNTDRFGSWTASASATYAMSKRLTFTGQLGKDFSTTATNSSVDALTATIDGQFAFSSRWSINGSAGWGRSQFLGEGGRIIIGIGPPPVLGPNREDTYVNWDVGLNYSLNEHLKVAASYTWFQNMSTVAYADFVRSAWTVNVSSRW